MAFDVRKVAENASKAKRTEVKKLFSGSSSSFGDKIRASALSTKTVPKKKKKVQPPLTGSQEHNAAYLALVRHMEILLSRENIIAIPTSSIVRLKTSGGLEGTLLAVMLFEKTGELDPNPDARKIQRAFHIRREFVNRIIEATGRLDSPQNERKLRTKIVGALKRLKAKK
ncbi:MAG: hypothetical protein Q8Q18_00670 [bacterium]|nr:hypothetical protein [bacterium]